jgi:hypothetical protein
MLNGIRVRVRIHPCSEGEDIWEDNADDKEDPELGKMSEVEEPGWVMSTISK